MSKLLLDQGLAPQTAALLRRQGFDALHVSEIGMERADDLDAHLAIAAQGRPSVILLRAEGLDAQGQADLIHVIDVRCEDALRDGAAVSADRKTVRVRRLPLR